MNRRYFFLAAGAAAASVPRRVSANDKVTIAMMGINGRAQTLAKWFGALPDVRIPTVCDVDSNIVGPVMKLVTESQGKEPVLVPDIRRVLDDKSIDAIVIATPMHWHAAGTILACDAGKDVYVEKPASHNLREGRWMVEAARRNNRIVQHGTQSRSRPVAEHFVQVCKSGQIGRVLMAKVMDCQGRRDIGHREDEPVPPGIDYDTWTGPVPMMPFNRNRYHGTVNWHWHYGGGDMTNDSVHFVDIARWALGAGYPTEVTGMGRKLYFDDDQQTPDTMNITFNYPDKVMQYEHRLWNPYRLEGSENTVAAYGTNGYAQIGRWHGGHYELRVFDSKGKLVLSDREPVPETTYHARDFIDSVKSRKAPNADIEIGHISAGICHLGNIVARLGRPVKFDPHSESIIGDAEASRYLERTYRKHWSTPKGGRIA